MPNDEKKQIKINRFVWVFDFDAPRCTLNTTFTIYWRGCFGILKKCGLETQTLFLYSFLDYLKSLGYEQKEATPNAFGFDITLSRF